MTDLANPHRSFPKIIQAEALERQGHKCGSCDAKITFPGEAGQSDHEYGERAEAHHVIPHRAPMNGPITRDNCVILCRACHLNAHQGGRFADISIYEDIKALPTMELKIATVAKFYPNYRAPDCPPELW